MSLPPHLEYVEMPYSDSSIDDGIPDPFGWFPLVSCRDCRWEYPATWSDLGDDAVDWQALHPTLELS